MTNTQNIILLTLCHILLVGGVKIQLYGNDNVFIYVQVISIEL